jgi:DHA1 family bicyclomycin/chloramphenicol resistance-like MFS transporter
LLAGQFVQGLGLGAPRIVTVAMIRDRYSGRDMARVMSFVLIVFTLVPTVSPGLGQTILLLADWRAIYQTLIGLAVVASLWFLARQPETLAPADRRPFRPGPILAGLREILRSGPALGYTAILGLMSGAFIGYLNLSQPILQERYGLGADYPTYFAFFAISISVASFLNGRLVLRLGMRVLCRAALWIVTGVAPIYGAFAYASANGRPPLWTLILFLMIVLFCFGILIGNLNALALESLGHLAGFASAVVGFCSTMLALPVAVLIGLSYDGSVLALVAGFAVCGGLATILLAGLSQRAAEVITAC